MRWDEQRVETEDDGRLFGLAEEAVVRTFDAPEAMGINFHEVRAKSALNRVPGGRYGFNWTINAYRGCTHACATKSPLLLRDIEIYERMTKRLPVSVNLSIPTLDEKVWRETEPHTPSPAARLDAVAELRQRGIDSGVLVAPLMPGINDRPEQVQPIVDRAREAGATFLGGVALHLRDEVRDVFFAWLESKRPDLIPKYDQLYSNGRAYLPSKQRGEVTKAVKGWGRSGAARRRVGRANAPRVEATTAPAQDSLF